jgi:nucleotide-binding universal stress UspA family protein
MTQRILLATRGTPSSAGALHYACDLAERGETIAEVISVFVLPALVPLSGGAEWSPPFSIMGREEQHRTVVAQLTDIGGPAPEWPVRTEMGAVVAVVIARVCAVGATLILVGAGHHGRAERLLGGGTTVHLMHASHVPVLSVPEDSRALPSTAVAATDFSAFSWDAALAAARLIGRGGRLHLLHVVWPPLAEESPDEDEWTRTYRTGAEHRLRAIANELAGETGVKVEVHLVAGDPTEQILSLRERTGAGLVAVGSHGLGFFGRIALGSVSTGIIRGAPCAVLVAPPSEPARDIEPMNEVLEGIRAPAHSGSGSAAGVRDL